MLKGRAKRKEYIRRSYVLRLALMVPKKTCAHICYVNCLSADRIKSDPRAVVYYIENERANSCSLVAVTDILERSSPEEQSAAVALFEQWIGCKQQDVRDSHDRAAKVL